MNSLKGPLCYLMTPSPGGGTEPEFNGAGALSLNELHKRIHPLPSRDRHLAGALIIYPLMLIIFPLVLIIFPLMMMIIPMLLIYIHRC